MATSLPDPIIVTKCVGDVRIHTFISTYVDDNLANATHIIESANVLVLVDAQFLAPYAKKFHAYADGIRKPIERIYVSHRHPDHWFGLAAFSGVEAYALPETTDWIRQNGEESVKEHRGKIGDDLVPSSVVVPQHITQPGVATIDGVTYRFDRVTDTEIDYHLTIGLPDIGVYFAQDLVYSGTHLYLTKDFAHWIEVLQALLLSEYDTFMPGHGKPADKNEIIGNIEYLLEAQSAYDRGLTNDAFKDYLLGRFPERRCPGIFKIYLERLFAGSKSV